MPDRGYFEVATSNAAFASFDLQMRTEFGVAPDPLVVAPVVVVDEEDEVVQGRVGRSRRRIILDDDEITVPAATPTPRRQRRQHVQRGQNSPIKFDGGDMLYR